MAKDGLFALLCAGGVVIALRALAGPGDNQDAVAAALAVQNAMQQGREFLLRGDTYAAVHVLEEQIARINGDAAYLKLLRDAYRAHVRELKLANQQTEAQRYLQRLQTLDPGAVLDAVVPGAKAAPPPAPPPAVAASAKAAPLPPAPATNVAAAVPANTAPNSARPEVKARGTRADEDDDPFRPPLPERQKSARNFLVQAEAEFANRRYPEACTLFDKAHQTEPASTAASQERWAYSKLFRVVDKLNHPPAEGPPWPELEKEVRLALELAPKLEYAKVLLGEIEKRKQTQRTVTAQHIERGSDGWARVETANFRIFHNQPREVAEQAAQAAERTRAVMSRKWFGATGTEWNPRCDIYLYATSSDYTRATQVGGGSPGHSSISTEDGRVVSRRIDLHCDDVPNLLAAVLPHETTHVIVAGQFGPQPMPRWADEGIAVLTEPPEKVERYLRSLTRCRQEERLMSLRQLMQSPDYPNPRNISAFYAQSVSVVDFLVGKKGPQVFTQFLHDALASGYEQALRRHYGYQSFEELQQSWTQQVFAAIAPPGVAQSAP